MVLAVAGIAWHSYLGMRLKAASAEAAAASVSRPDPDPDPEGKPLLASVGSANLRASSTSPSRGESLK